ncbi:hypothetical protein DPMN_016066 [Dreissena polymorpha]|uniref:Secreted protein n=1 Tax=Dreissena polymorpha TaxID=45954 RepID=A0A9D4NCR1_DREPO|nr:hypothetical protein DPMN_016066 [Dreissena polymorpha]
MYMYWMCEIVKIVFLLFDLNERTLAVCPSWDVNGFVVCLPPSALQLSGTWCMDNWVTAGLPPARSAKAQCGN